MSIKVKITYSSATTDSYIDYGVSEFFGGQNSSFGDTYDAISNVSNKFGLKDKYYVRYPFLLYYSKLGDGSTLENSFAGIISTTNPSGEYYKYWRNCFHIILRGKNINRVAIWFDKQNNRYAKLIFIKTTNGTQQSYTNDSPFFFQEFSNPNNEDVIIDCCEWNFPDEDNPDFMPIIDSITLDVEDEYDERAISNLVCGHQIASDISSPNFSIVGLYGSFDVQDANHYIRDYKIKGLLGSSAVVEILYNNNVIGTYNTESWTYQAKGYIFSVNLASDLDRYNNIIIPRMLYEEDKSAWELFTYLFSFSALNKYTIEDDVKSRLQAINIKHYYSDGGTLAEMMNKFCALAKICILIKTNEWEIIDYA